MQIRRHFFYKPPRMRELTHCPVFGTLGVEDISFSVKKEKSYDKESQSVREK